MTLLHVIGGLSPPPIKNPGYACDILIVLFLNKIYFEIYFIW